MTPLRELCIYLPSLMTRYSIQVMLIALPWILQTKNISLSEISLTLGSFYCGSLITGIFATKIIRGRSIDSILRLCIALQAIVSAGCFFTSNLQLLFILRFFQGAFLGLLRPVNQIWLIELKSERDPSKTAQVATYSQVLIALGMALGGYFGALSGRFSSSAFEAIVFAVAISILPAIFVLCFTPRLKNVDQYREQSQSSSEPMISVLLTRPALLDAVFAYALSLTVFKIWIMVFPFWIRQSLAIFSYGDLHGKNIEYFLGTIFLIHPLSFSAAQWFFGKSTPRMPKSSNYNLLILVCAVFAQAFFTWASIFLGNIWLSGFFIILGGGIISAAIYPSLMCTVMRELESHSSHLKRSMMVILSVSADIGQLLGSLFLIFPQWFNIRMEAMLYPVTILIFWFLIRLAFRRVLWRRIKLAATNRFFLSSCIDRRDHIHVTNAIFNSVLSHLWPQSKSNSPKAGQNWKVQRVPVPRNFQKLSIR